MPTAFPARISAGGSTYAVRRATCADVGAIVELIAAEQIGATRAQIEAVRVREDLRGRGLGHALVEWAIGEARRRGCALIQLTSDKRRDEAHRFYGRLGFTASHEGFKLRL
jgi:GNAT superfamily N-acetyltransferase